MQMKHALVVSTQDSGDGKVSTNAWNDDHILTGTPGAMIGFNALGTGEEVTVGAGLSYADGVLTGDTAELSFAQVVDRAALADLATTNPAYLTESGREGVFVYDSSVMVVQVAADTQQGIYVPPSTDTTGASGAWVRKFDGPVRGEWFGINSSSTDNYAAINAARAVAVALKRTLKLPTGTLTIDQAAPTFTLLDGEQIEGSPGTIIHVADTLNTTASIFAASSKSGIRLSGFKLEAASLRTVGNLAFDFRDCVDCYVGDVVMDKWTQGVCFTAASGGSVGSGPIPPASTNLRNKAERCVSLSSRSYAFFMECATACEFLHCEAYNVSNLDGFKFGGGTMFAKVIGCHAEGCAGDGFDTYDGFIASVMADCTSYNNTSNGFQLKGILGGTYTSGDYVTRQSVFSNLVASGNALAGFLFQEMRYSSVTGLVATGNGTSGFVINNIQGTIFSGCSAVRNTQHGWSIISGTSRCIFSGCLAIDNSYVDGTTQNGTYDGWNINTAQVCYFNGCFSLNGTQPGKIGGQGYAFNLTTSTTLHFVGGGTRLSVTGAIGGTNPFTSNTFNAFDLSDSLINSTPQVQSVTSAATVTPTFANDLVKITAQAAALTLANPTGQALAGKRITIRIKDNGTSRAITYGTQYRAMATALPTTTVISKTLYLDCMWNADDTKLDVLNVVQQA